MGKNDAEPEPEEGAKQSSPHGSTGQRLLNPVAGFRFLICVIVLWYCWPSPIQQIWSKLNQNVPHGFTTPTNVDVLAHRANLRAQCATLHTPAGPPPDFNPASRRAEGSDRFVPGTKTVLFRNAKIWTGGRNGTEVIHGDVLIAKGVVQAIGYVPQNLVKKFESRRLGEKVEVLDVQGKWITPGLVDLHSHIGVGSAPGLSGAADTNSHQAPILPWLRSIDGLNTHDDAYELAIAGGVTTAQVLPGSANNIGGQSFVIKLRPTDEKSVISKVVEPPVTLAAPNVTQPGWVAWRHMKHACGENPKRRYSQTRMDGVWNFRNAYNQAKIIKEKQDAFCAKVEQNDWEGLLDVEDDVDVEKKKERRKVNEVDLEFPEQLQWEALVDVLRGRVKLSVHCYEATDLDGMVRLTNEFKFPISSFHHAGETYLVPSLLKRVYPGKAPAIALFASNFRKKREAYRGSEFAPAILAGEGVPVVMKSDHPVVNSRYLLFEAQQAHYYGLPANLALASVTTTPAEAAGMGHRVGRLAEGYDADLVIWDSHPLQLGATPTQVYIDGIAQIGTPITSPVALDKPTRYQDTPKVPDFRNEAKEAVRWDGVPPLGRAREGWRVYGDDGRTVIVSGVRSMYMRKEDRIMKVFDDTEEGQTHATGEAGRRIVVRRGEVVCVEGYTMDEGPKLELDALDMTPEECSRLFHSSLSYESNTPLGDNVVHLDLKGGSIEPGLTAFGSPLGLVEISLEPSTNDGVIDGEANALDNFDVTRDGVKAVDGLAFEGRSALLAYMSGVTTGITAPIANQLVQGLGVAFNLGAPHALETGAVMQRETGMHVRITMSDTTSVSSNIEALRGLLYSVDGEDRQGGWDSVRQGMKPLVITVQSADIMASLLALKREYKERTGITVKMTFAGAAEAHLIKEEIAQEGVWVVVTETRSYPGSWEGRRIMRGPPLEEHTVVTSLLEAGVNVAIGILDEAYARNTRFEIGWIFLNSNGSISRAAALSLASTNVERALGVQRKMLKSDMVMYEGGNSFEWRSKVVGTISGEGGWVEVF